MSASQSGGAMCVWSVTFSLGLVSIAADSCPTPDILLRVNRLEHEQGFPQVPAALLCNALVELSDLAPSFLVPHCPQDSANLVLCRRSDSDKQRSTADGCNDIACGVCEQNQS